MRSYGWALIQSGWGPSKKRRSGHERVLRDDHVRTQGEDGRLQAQERGLKSCETPHRSFVMTVSWLSRVVMAGVGDQKEAQACWGVTRPLLSENLHAFLRTGKADPLFNMIVIFSPKVNPYKPAKAMR